MNLPFRYSERREVALFAIIRATLGTREVRYYTSQSLIRDIPF